jgi:hypothetical protein
MGFKLYLPSQEPVPSFLNQQHDCDVIVSSAYIIWARHGILRVLCENPQIFCQPSDFLPSNQLYQVTIL